MKKSSSQVYLLLGFAHKPFSVSVHQKLQNVLGQIELCDQFLMSIVEIISCVKESIGESTDQTVGVLRISGQRIAAGACGNVAVQILMLFQKLLNDTAGKNGTFGIALGLCPVISGNVCPKAGGVTKKCGVGAQR